MSHKSRRNFLQSCFYTLFGSYIPPIFAKSLVSGASSITNFEPGYLKLHRNGVLKERGERLWSMMERCALCPRECGANRLQGERGFCNANAGLEIASYHPHFGEEKPLVGESGSGTIFMTHCGLRCVFCINWEVSQEGEGTKHDIEAFTAMMLKLQKRGCPNINIVTPTHYVPHILLALDIAAANGLNIPLVYNTCGWEKPEILNILNSVVDIYLPDFKYANSDHASKYSSGAAAYPEVTQEALLEMHRQVGRAKPANDGLMYRGLMIRHLVMPNNIGGTKEVLEWIARNLPKDTYINLMSQYQPMYKADQYSEIARRLSRGEYTQAVKWAKAAELTNLDIQGYRN